MNACVYLRAFELVCLRPPANVVISLRIRPASPSFSPRGGAIASRKTTFVMVPLSPSVSKVSPLWHSVSSTSSKALSRARRATPLPLAPVALYARCLALRRPHTRPSTRRTQGQAVGWPGFTI